MRKEARKKKKLDKTGWGIVTVVIILALLSASRQVDVKVDGTKELKSGKASAKLLAKYAAAEPADLLTSQTAAKKRSAVLVFAGLTDSQESNEKILDYLKKAGVSAAFALPAARARENDVLIKDLVKSRQQLIGSGILGTEGSQAAEDLLPKLQLAKKSLEAVFDVGFQYAVSGDGSTNDYEQTSFQKHLNDLKYGSGKDDNDYKVTNGSVIVMHMLENAKYTAQVLDIMIPVWKKAGYRFARVDQYTAAYSRQRAKESN